MITNYCNSKCVFKVMAVRNIVALETVAVGNWSSQVEMGGEGGGEGGSNLHQSTAREF
jgi:hypothetical protein